jgi:hypothetical protein
VSTRAVVDALGADRERRAPRCRRRDGRAAPIAKRLAAALGTILAIQQALEYFGPWRGKCHQRQLDRESEPRHSAVTNLVASGTGEAAAISITGHADPNVFKRCNVRRDAVQAEAAERRNAYLAAHRGTTPAVTSIAKK